MAVKTHKPAVGLDSQCLSYVLDALAGIKEPTDSLAERKSRLSEFGFTQAKRLRF